MTDRRGFLLGSSALAAAAHVRRASAAGDKVLRVAFPTAESSFDPQVVQDLYSSTVNYHIFDSPLTYDYMARPAKLIPNTAVALPQISPDFRTFTLKIRPGIFFQDDPAFKGKPRELVAEDYAYSIKRVFDPRWKSQVLFELEASRIVGIDAVRQRAIASRTAFDYSANVAGLRVLDRYTLQFQLAEPNPRFAYVFTSALIGAVAREVVETYGDDIGAHPVGTGPFRLASWRRSSRIVLERNPAFRELRYEFEPAADAPELTPDLERLRGQRVPFVDRVEISIIDEDQPRWLAFMQGALDLLEVPFEFVPLTAPNGNLAPNLVRRGVRHRATAMSDVTVTYFNMEHPVVGGMAPEQVALRRAVSLAFDGPGFIREIYQGSAVIAQSPLVPNTFGHDTQPPTELSQFSPGRARALLDTYGFIDRDGDGWRERPDGSPLTLEIASAPTQRDRRQNEHWKRSMDAVGLRTSFFVAQWPELLKQSLAGKLMIWGFGWTATVPDSDLFLSLGYGPNRESSNDARFDLPAFNQLYEKQHRLPDGEERRAAILEATRLLVAYMPYKYHLHRIRHDLAQPWVIGYRRHPIMQRQWLWLDIDLAKRAAAGS